LGPSAQKRLMAVQPWIQDVPADIWQIGRFSIGLKSQEGAT
jgi:hypothetical protein